MKRECLTWPSWYQRVLKRWMISSRKSRNSGDFWNHYLANLQVLITKSSRYFIRITVLFDFLFMNHDHLTGRITYWDIVCFEVCFRPNWPNLTTNLKANLNFVLFKFFHLQFKKHDLHRIKSTYVSKYPDTSNWFAKVLAFCCYNHKEYNFRSCSIIDRSCYGLS